VAFINRMNAEGVAVLGRLSPAVVISLLRAASPQLCAHVAALDPFATAAFGVSWAGEQKSANWFDTAREYTERWHHQQQIRLATNKPGIMTRELYFPVLDAFMRALPFTYRDVSAPAGTRLQVNVSGDAGGSWYLRREPEAWMLTSSGSGAKAAEVTIPQEIAWRIFTKGIHRDEASSQLQFRGDAALALHILTTIAIIG
jgi:hypothetical protein